MISHPPTPSPTPHVWAAWAASFVVLAGCSAGPVGDDDLCTAPATCTADASAGRADASAGDGGTDRGADARERDAASQPTDAGTSATSDSEYAVDVSSQLATPCDFTIGNNGDWGEINNPAYRVICVEPGDYTDAGTVTLSADGSAAAPRVLRLVSSVDPALHPINATGAQQAWAPRLRLNNANYWIIDRLSFNYPSNLQITVANGSSDNVINRLNMYGGVNAMRQFLDFQGVCNCHRNVVQNSVFGGVGFTADSVCVTFNGTRVYAQMHDNRVVQNEFINCNDGVQLVTTRGDPSGNFEGTVIDQNDIYLTDDYYVNCSTGALDPDGKCACAENAIDLKAGGDNTANPVIISNNRMYGFRDTYEGGVCGTGSGAWGAIIVAHWGVKNLILESNVLFDGPRGYFDGRQTDGPITIRDNIFHTIHDDAAASGGGHALVLNNASSTAAYRVHGNRFVNTVYFDGSTVKNEEFFDNDMVNAGRLFQGPGANLNAHDNRWWSTTRPGPYSNSGDTLGSANDSGLGRGCFKARRFTDPSFEICLDHVRRP